MHLYAHQKGENIKKFQNRKYMYFIVNRYNLRNTYLYTKKKKESMKMKSKKKIIFLIFNKYRKKSNPPKY